MNKQHFYIANWKMYWTFDETINFVAANYDHLLRLAGETNSNIILCPSYPALYPLSVMFKETPIAVSAQDCSEYHKGAFTGQVSANHLKDAGCKYCIIGHSEQRALSRESNQAIANKCMQLLQAGIVPIICVGETKDQADQALPILQEQLNSIFSAIQAHTHSENHTSIIIAYEPVWAIGSGQVPTSEHLATVYSWLAKATTDAAPTANWKFIYGGSVSSKTVNQFKKINMMSGFLIGNASLDFQEFEKIVKWNKDNTL